MMSDFGELHPCARPGLSATSWAVQRRCAKATAQLLRDTGRRRRPKRGKTGSDQ
jgi:hypothetical protein